ncbi:YHS domain-containing (seleno)protein [Bosea sp. (in: a-proteobacteria)]|uniref:YHS domain-containing (seleno)protein n=1 Tax=Bosea sp. (in: a-proteobacteria) TaxID=1871050 RepID=UPI003342E249
MKAATWQSRLRPAAICLAMGLSGGTAPAGAPDAPAAAPLLDTGLPAGLPQLPALGEAMQPDPRTGLALNGFDPVSYRLGGGPVAGRPDCELIHDGIVWRFASAANRAAFREAPAVYAPAFAGFDPTGVAEGVAVESDPGRFAVVGTRLYLFRSEENRARFLREPSLRDAAKARWSAVRRSVAAR